MVGGVLVLGKNFFREPDLYSPSKSIFGKVFIALFGILLFLVIVVFGILLGFIAYDSGILMPWLSGAAFALVMLNIVFYQLLRAPTALGRKVLDEIEGLKLYLSVAEQDRMNFHNPPQQTPELFEKFLPYALALGVEHEWAEQFSAMFQRLESQGTHYTPHWYMGGSWSGVSGVGNFASTLGKSISSSISSSSGSSGGGGAGGGGGGGGGGGW